MAKEKEGNMEVLSSFESASCLCIVNLQLKELFIHVLYAV